MYQNINVQEALGFNCQDVSKNRSRSSCSPPPADQDTLRTLDADDLSIANTGLKRGVDESEQAIGGTTKHPRHRPGCGCIVCTQPPSKRPRRLISRRKKKSGSGAGRATFLSEAPSNDMDFRMRDVADDMLEEALAGIDIASIIHAASMPLDMFLRETAKNPPA